MLVAVTTPLLWALTRRLDRSARDREHLLEAAADASESERRRIARDLHDGVVQELAGTSFALSATARDPQTAPETAARLTPMSGELRSSLRSLRSLLVEIYPPDLGVDGLGAALHDLVAPAAEAGVTATVEVFGVESASDESVAAGVAGRPGGGPQRPASRGRGPPERAGPHGRQPAAARRHRRRGRFRAPARRRRHRPAQPARPDPRGGRPSRRTQCTRWGHHGARGGGAVTEPIRVVLVDDHAVVRSGLAQLLTGAGDIEVVGQAGDGAEAVEVVRATRPRRGA